MATRIVTANGVYDLSNVTNLEHLQEEINFLKESIKQDELHLEEHFRHLPQKIVRSTADSVLPSFMNKLIANGSWKLLVSGISMFANPFSKKFSFKKNILSSAKRLGLITLIRSAYNAWNNRKVSNSKQIVSAKKSGITSLKTKRLK